MRLTVASIFAKKAGLFEYWIDVAIPLAANILWPTKERIAAWLAVSMKHSPEIWITKVLQVGTRYIVILGHTISDQPSAARTSPVHVQPTAVGHRTRRVAVRSNESRPATQRASVSFRTNIA